MSLWSISITLYDNEHKKRTKTVNDRDKCIESTLYLVKISVDTIEISFFDTKLIAFLDRKF